MIINSSSITKPFALILLFSLSACISTDQVVTQKDLKPAVLSKPSQALSMQFETIISSMLNGQNVKLADDVFSRDSTILIERTAHKNNQGQLLNGRSTEKAQSISLLTNHAACYLRHEQSQKIIALPSHIKCVAE